MANATMTKTETGSCKCQVCRGLVPHFGSREFDCDRVFVLTADTSRAELRFEDTLGDEPMGALK